MGSSIISPETSGEMATTRTGSIFPVAVTIWTTSFMETFSVVTSMGFPGGLEKRTLLLLQRELLQG